jgi:glycosyltransferase involved in cell wall biosynthesis
MKILHLLATIDPRAGGPLEGVRQCGAKMRSMGHLVEVASLDAPDAQFLPAFPLPVHALGPSHGHYRYAPRLVPWLRAHATRFDAVIVNGLWQYHSLGAWKALHSTEVPYYVFPHGMLDPWFKRAYPLKHLKKWLYWPWAEYRVLRDARAVLFTTEDERMLARRSFGLYRATERVVSFGTSAPPQDATRLRDLFLAAYPELKGKRVILFLGRIHVKKGCDLLIRAFARIAQSAPDTHVVIAGPDSTGWVATLKAQAKELGIAHRITWPGMLQDDRKWGAFYASDAFILPSHQENFGIAVAEALGCGAPALISDKVNIWREVEDDGAGFVASDTAAGTELNLTRWLGLNAASQLRMRAQAIETFNARFSIEAMSKDLLSVLQAGTAGFPPRSAASPLFVSSSES